MVFSHSGLNTNLDKLFCLVQRNEPVDLRAIVVERPIE